MLERDRVTITGTGNATYDGRAGEIIRVLSSGRCLVWLDGFTTANGLRAYDAKYLAPIPPPPPAPAPAPPPAPPSGAVLLDEQFTSPTLDLTRWAPYASPGNHSPYPGLRKPEAVSIIDGQLVITATYANGIITSGAVAHRLDWTYGSVELRARTDPDPTGQMSGVGLRWPRKTTSEASPGDGEIDFYETTNAVDRRLRAFLHYGGAANSQKSVDYGVAATDWHTIRMDCRPDAITLTRDGVVAHVERDPAVLSTLQRGGHVCLQLDTFGRNGYVPLPAPVRMFIDYVRITGP